MLFAPLRQVATHKDKKPLSCTKCILLQCNNIQFVNNVNNVYHNVSHFS